MFYNDIIIDDYIENISSNNNLSNNQENNSINNNISSNINIYNAGEEDKKNVNYKKTVVSDNLKKDLHRVKNCLTRKQKSDISKKNVKKWKRKSRNKNKN